MAESTVAIGEILMLSQLSWRVGCAFTAGREAAPQEFHEVEQELKSLTTAITLMAESVDMDGGLLARAEVKTREGLVTILSSCRQTLNDLDSFVNQYQEVRKPSEAGGMGSRRIWRQVLIRNYQSIMWTVDGGGIQVLRNLLAMHTQSIAMSTRALQRYDPR